MAVKKDRNVFSDFSSYIKRMLLQVVLIVLLNLIAYISDELVRTL